MPEERRTIEPETLEERAAAELKMQNSLNAKQSGSGIIICYSKTYAKTLNPDPIFESNKAESASRRAGADFKRMLWYEHPHIAIYFLATWSMVPDP